MPRAWSLELQLQPPIAHRAPPSSSPPLSSSHRHRPRHRPRHCHLFGSARVRCCFVNGGCPCLCLCLCTSRLVLHFALSHVLSHCRTRRLLLLAIRASRSFICFADHRVLRVRRDVRGCAHARVSICRPCVLASLSLPSLPSPRSAIPEFDSFLHSFNTIHTYIHTFIHVTAHFIRLQRVHLPHRIASHRSVYHVYYSV